MLGPPPPHTFPHRRCRTVAMSLFSRVSCPRKPGIAVSNSSTSAMLRVLVSPHRASLGVQVAEEGWECIKAINLVRSGAFILVFELRPDILRCAWEIRAECNYLQQLLTGHPRLRRIICGKRVHSFLRYLSLISGALFASHAHGTSLANFPTTCTCASSASSASLRSDI